MVGPGTSMGRSRFKDKDQQANYFHFRTQKVVVCGARGCGKTSVLEKLIYGNNGVKLFRIFSFFLNRIVVQPFSSTIEDVYVANIETDRGNKEKIRYALNAT